MAHDKEFKSPVHKLVKFFEKSRDNWKLKYKAEKAENKRLKNQVYKLGLSKQKLKGETNRLKEQLSKISHQATHEVLPCKKKLT